MAGFERVTRSIQRRVLRGLTRVDHARRYRRTLRRGAVGRKAVRAARSQWWGGDSRWFPGGTPPRQHNRVNPLIDGESYFAALREALEEATGYVYIAAWCLTPHIPLGRESAAAIVDTRLLELLSRVAQRVPVRILLWSGAPLLLQPTKRSVNAARDTIEKEGRGDIECRLDNTARFTHCHHQKAVVVDGRVAFVGGMDVTTFSGDRWDTNEHPLRAGQNWHDVQVRIEGEAVADVEQNFRQRWTASGGDPNIPHGEPEVEESWHTPVQIARTVPSKTYRFAPRGEFGIHHFYVEAIRTAKRLIYLENQYIWSPYIMEALTDAINAPHEESFRVVIVLPAFAGDGRWDNDKHVQQLRDLDNGRGIVSIYSLYTSGPNEGEHPFTYRAIYVHAKVAVIDDEWLTVGSANLNNRGLITDGEMNAVMHDAELAKRTRVALWAEHLAMPRHEVEAADPIEMIDHVWTGRGKENEQIIQHGVRPLSSAVHRYTVGRLPSDLVLEDFQSLTFEL